MEAETQRKVRIIAIAIAAALLITAGIIAIRKRSVPQTPLEEQGANAPATSAAPSTEVGPAVPEKPIPDGSIPKDTLEAQLKRTTMDFVARFGTYSTDAENANLKQLLSRMGPQLKAWAQARLNKISAASAFQGVTTHAISSKIVNLTASTATLEIGTQRIYRDGTPTGVRTAYEIATVSLVKSGQTWLVDAVSWKEYKPQ